jgi:hypothetical protein
MAMPVSSPTSRTQVSTSDSVAVLRAGDALPEAGRVGALEQQHVERSGVDDDEDGFGDLEGAVAGHALVWSDAPRGRSGGIMPLSRRRR